MWSDPADLTVMDTTKAATQTSNLQQSWKNDAASQRPSFQFLHGETNTLGDLPTHRHQETDGVSTNQGFVRKRLLVKLHGNICWMHLYVTTNVM